MPSFWTLILCSWIMADASSTKPPAPADLDRLFAGFEATLVLHEAHSNETWVYNPTKSKVGTLPCSTFKIPNTAIGLEHGLLKNADTVFIRDDRQFPIEEWWPKTWRVSQAKLSEAFKYSMVWFYCSLADQVTNQVIGQYLAKWDYPVPDNPPPGDYFWLRGEYQVTPHDQIQFLRKLYFDQLSLKPATTATLKQIMLLEETEDYRFSGKTGLCALKNGTKVGWLVGFVEHQQGLYFYAMRLEGKEYKDIMEHRVPLIRKLFKNMKLFT